MFVREVTVDVLNFARQPMTRVCLGAWITAFDNVCIGKQWTWSRRMFVHGIRLG